MIDSLPTPSPTVAIGFTILPPLLALIVVAGLARTCGPKRAGIGAAAFLVWLALTGVLAAIGFFDAWAPPRLILVLIAVIAVLIWASRAGWAARLASLPLGLLVGFQSFRILVELLIHRAVAEGVAAPTLTWTGTNFDMIPGISALLLAPFAHRIPRRGLQGWNIASALVLLFTVVTALLATPTPFQQIHGDPPNVWIATFPFVWLPAVLVLCAWLGHIVLFRRLAGSN